MRDKKTLIVVSIFLGLAVLGILVALMTGGFVPYKTSSLSRSLIGHRAVVELLRRNEFRVTINKHDRPKREEGEGLAVFAPSPEEIGVGEPSWRRLTDQFTPQLVVLPKWKGKRHPRKKHWVYIYGRYEPSQVKQVLPEGEEWAVGFQSGSGDETEKKGETRTIRSESGQTFAVRTRGIQYFQNEEAGTVLWRSDDGPVVIRDPDTGRVWVSDPDFVSNMFLSNANNAGFAVSLFREVFPRRRLIVDERFRGFDVQESMLELLFTFPGLILTLSVSFLILCFYWWLHCSWSGRRRDEKQERSRLEQADAMGRLTHAHGDHAHAARLYVSNFRTRIAEAISLPRDADWGRIKERLDSLRPALADQLRAISSGLDQLNGPDPGHRTIIEVARKINHVYEQLRHGVRQESEEPAAKGN